MIHMSAGVGTLGDMLVGVTDSGPPLEIPHMLPTYSNMQTLTKSHREHRELGEMAWLRDFEQAQAEARARSKPILLLFQEVPGCSTCVNFGQDVLSHPLMVDMIEDHFVPLAIFNNHPGPDATILRRFGEAAWNNPVIHFIAADGAPIVPRLANRYDPLGLHSKIAQVLASRDDPIPAYFNLLGRGLLVETGLAEAATYTTPCFWSGETSLAQHSAVISTDAGWVHGEEVVRVLFDPREGGRAALDGHAHEEGFRPIDGRSFALDREPQFYLRKSAMRFLPLSPAQRSAINLALPYRRDAKELLSHRQRTWLNDPRLEQASEGELYRLDIRQGWALLEDALGRPAQGAQVQPI